MPKLIVHIGASADRNLGVAFRPVLQAAKAARVQVGNEMAAAGKATGDGIKKGTSQADKEFAKLATQAARWHKQMVRDAERSVAQQTKAAEQGARQQAKSAERAAMASTRAQARAMKEAEAGVAAYTRMVEREADKRGRAEAKAARTSAGAAHQSWRDRRRGGDMVYGGLRRGIGAAAGAAGGFVGGIAHGIGIETDLGKAAGAGVKLETTATDLANSGYMPGQDGANGKRQDPAAIQAEMRAVGKANAMDPNKAAEGLQAFVAKTGDLETGRTLMMDMAKYSRATGANLEEMTDAAGDVANALGNTDNKAEKVKAVMRAIAAQGKEGAVEIKDLAAQMAKLGAASAAFSGDPVEVMAQMGALVQMTRAHGGASTATQAATSVTSFANTFSKGARLAQFEHFGVQVKNEKTGQNLPVKDIIVNSIAAASAQKNGGMKNFDKNMGKMFADVRARSVTKGFEKTFMDAGGGAKGIEKVKEAFDHLALSTMNEKDITDAFNLSMGTTEAKVQAFNNELAASANDMRANLQPALEALAPAALTAAKALAEGIGRILGVKTAKDAGIDKLEGNVGRDTKLVNRVLKRDNERDEKTGKIIPKQLSANVTEKLSAEKTALDTAIEGEEKRLAALRAPKKKPTTWDFMKGKPMLDALVNDPAKKAEENAVASRLIDLKKEQADLASTMSAIDGAIEAGTLRVTIVADRTTGPVAGGPPKVDASGRTEIGAPPE